MKAVAGGGTHEPQTHELVRELLLSRPGEIVHAGAFFGDMIEGFGSSTSHSVYAFEPVLENYVLARRNLELAEQTNVLLFHAALGRRVGNVRVNTLSADSKHLGGASYVGFGDQVAPQLSIDSFGFKALSLIHLDVEGYEKEVLGGAMRSIRKFKPFILLEDNKQECDQLLAEEGYVRGRKVHGLRLWVPDDSSDYAVGLGE